ncbi:hypothetical protein [Dipodfec virus UOA04_Rod_880]|nr:hypothetical protein [Dipodfec virus UOA04_Rod_880]
MKWKEFEPLLGEVITERVNAFLDDKEFEIKKKQEDSKIEQKRKKSDIYKLISSVSYKDGDLFGNVTHHVVIKEYVNLVTGVFTIKKIVLK